ncbi:MAG: UDP-glucose--hexose-1-phosphate uridylyltransferase [Clostridia bacterium]|nr:UDP-glucose--hexose-1-phosphate uridylyltransferase [Clostridia bacterium]
MVDNAILDLVDYGVSCNLLRAEDEIFVTNSLLSALGMSDFSPDRKALERPLEEILGDLLDFAAKKGLIDAESQTERDLFDAKLMGLLMPRPSQVIAGFWADYAEDPVLATDNYYAFSQDSDYIRRYRICKDVKWQTATPYGDLDITINLSKPEKDPKAIAAALNSKSSNYPKCALCKENEGYAGRMNAAARQNHRIIPLDLSGEEWFLQYSPYVYYNEHCIVLCGEHTPMKISRKTFERLLQFTTIFPHYFLGSNADLPIVGGSILTHDHFQGGHFEFAMERAPIAKQVEFKGFGQVKASIVKWPMSVLRLRSADKDVLVDLADKILGAWRGYTDEASVIFAETDGVPHNTITPIARRRGEDFELDLVLRNNLTTEEHPFGLYHPHAELHHIKKENIGLIEVMGLAVLPARLKDEMAQLKDAILNGKPIHGELEKHKAWVEEFLPCYESITEENIDEILQNEIGKVFCRVLEHGGVYKDQDAFMRFVDYVNEQ